MTNTILKRARAWGALLATGVLVLAGCGASDQTEVSRGPYTIYIHGDSLLPRGGDDALIQGTVVTRNGCVLLGFGNGAAYPVVWPSGTSIVDDDPLTLRLRSGDQVTVGQTVRSGGGSHDVASPMVTVDIADECRSATGEVLIFNPDGNIDLDA
jgi:hypothetical protein